MDLRKIEPKTALKPARRIYTIVTTGAVLCEPIGPTFIAIYFWILYSITWYY